MQLPVDVKALLDEVTNINSAQDAEISVSIYIDEAAAADLVAHVRNAFASSLPTVRMTITYLRGKVIAQPTDDFAVVVAGSSERVGEDAANLRAVGVPVMIVTAEPECVTTTSLRCGHAIPDGDLVAPLPAEGEAPAEPLVLNGETAANLDERMGRWIVSVCREKRLAYARAFPFVRRPLARDAVRTTSLENAGVGLIPLIPGADLPIMTLNQAKMVMQIAAAYGHEMNVSRWKELLAVVGGAYLCRTLARELIELVPVLGFVWKTGIAYGGTAAIGYAVIEYFEGGENVVGVANVIERAAEASTKAVEVVRQKADALAAQAGDAAATA